MKRILIWAVTLTVGMLTLGQPATASTQADTTTAAKPANRSFVMKDPDDASVLGGEPSKASIQAAALNRTVVRMKKANPKKRSFTSMRFAVHIGGLVTPADEPDLLWHVVNVSARTQVRDEWVYSAAYLFSPGENGERVAATQGGSGCSTWRLTSEEDVVVFKVWGTCLKGVRSINRVNIGSSLIVDQDGEFPHDANVLDSDTSHRVIR